MTKPIIRIHDQELDEVIDREMTDAEYETYLTEVAAGESIKAEEAAKAAAKAELLERLGITEDEAKLLLS